MKFSELQLMPTILRALTETGYVEPTPIQQQAIGPALEGRDLLGCAQTGTGKTAAFALPILQQLERHPRRAGVRRTAPRCLVLTPTRELALQILESFETYSRHLHQRACVIFGGVSQVPQVNTLRNGVDILVATPGRLIDLMNQKLLQLEGIEIFVLDEADRMLDMGFITDVRRVIEKLPQQRQTMLFSATMPPEIERLADSILENPVKVAVTPPATTVELIEQSVYLTDKREKRQLLKWLLEGSDITSALVFTRTKHGADRVARELNAAHITAQAIHGNKSQGARQQALEGFKSGRCRVLVATDIAARGIDINELSHVVNYDLPNVPETYVHRIGRTGRAGLSGTAISFCDCEELPYLKDIQKLIRIDIPVAQENPYPMSVFEAPPKAEQPPRRRNNDRPAGPPRSKSGQASRSGAPKSSGGSQYFSESGGGPRRRRRRPTGGQQN